MRRALKGLLLAALVFAAPLAHAVEPDEMLRDPTLEARARSLSAQLRCMVCQNQSIDDSDADLAHEVRVLIRQRIVKGESNAAIKTFLVSRYGDFILLKPPLRADTLMLWGGAPVLLLIGGLFLVVSARRRAAARLSPPPLSAAEAQRLAALVDEPPA